MEGNSASERYMSALSGQIANVSSQLFSEIENHRATNSELLQARRNIQAWEAVFQTAQQTWDSTCATIRAELEWTRIQLQAEQNKSHQLMEENRRLKQNVGHIITGRAVSVPAPRCNSGQDENCKLKTEVHSETSGERQEYPEEYALECLCKDCSQEDDTGGEDITVC